MVYDLEYSPYRLFAKRPLNRFGNTYVDGFLLRIHFKDYGTGYASLQAWRELGDADLNQELEALLQKSPLPLGKRALDFARRDAIARHQNQKLYSHFTFENHYTLGTPVYTEIPTAFKILKIKLDSHFAKTLISHDWLKKFLLRIDFNLALTEKDIPSLLLSLKDFSIDFIEDAGINIPHYNLFYDETKQNKTNLIIKPAKEKVSNMGHRMIFTSYMDHPVNQIHAAYVAQDFYHRNPDKKELCGLRSDLLFSDSPYLEYFAKETSIIRLQDDGYGIGFTSLLEKEKWKT